MSKQKIRILGTGAYLPARCVSEAELEKSLKLKTGWIEKHCGVKTRYYAEDEEASSMGAKAAASALDAAGLSLSDLDAVIGVSGVPQQAIPSMAALIHKKLGLQGQLAFDVNSTCLSFLTGFKIAANMITSGSLKHVLLVSADIASVGLNPEDPKTATLFGDGAAAVIVGPSESTSSNIRLSKFETWTEAQDACQFESGGSKLHLKDVEPKQKYFFMNGPKLFKVAVPKALKMAKEMLKEEKLSMDDLSLVIPHQASPGALHLFERKLRIPACKFLNIVQDFGNMIATSLPFSLHHAIKQNRLKRGDTCMMLGTSAGISIGGVIFEY